MIRLLLVLLVIVCTQIAFGRADSTDFRELHEQRIHTDMTGMKVLGAWGLANTVAGITGAAIADDNESRHFHQMNATWGIVNLGIAVLGYMGARNELGRSVSNTDAMHRWESKKRLYLVNAGLDGLYIGTGVFLLKHGQSTTGDADLYKGFGKSLLLQGAGLLVFDVSMFLSHQSRDKAWYHALEGLCVTGDGIGWRYPIR